MILSILTWGTIVGLVHFLVIGALYGNPLIDRIYQQHQQSDPAVRRWDSRPRYLITQFLGTQVEVFVLTAGFVWLRNAVGEDSWAGALSIAALFTAIRIYPRFWNMWIQSNYPRKMLAIEAVNGTISTVGIVLMLHAVV